jgi:hypothetical protein
LGKTLFIVEDENADFNDDGMPNHQYSDDDNDGINDNADKYQFDTDTGNDNDDAYPYPYPYSSDSTRYLPSINNDKTVTVKLKYMAKYKRRPSHISDEWQPNKIQCKYR